MTEKSRHRPPARILSAATVGLDGVPVDVEVDVLTGGLHQFTVVGLPDAAIREARDRVSAAVKNSGFTPVHHCGRVTVNLAPADIPKYGAVYDLPIAIGILTATGQLPTGSGTRMFVGALSLDGTVRPVGGVLPFALLARARGIAEVYVPADNADEARIVDGIVVYAVSSLAVLAAHLTGTAPLQPVPHLPFDLAAVPSVAPPVDFADVRGQAQAKRALEIAAAGGHNVLLSGTPGSGKTLMAKAMPGILPRLTLDDALEITKIHSVAGRLSHGVGLLGQRPLRAPHHSASVASLIGGGSVPRPGEISLAHHGVLFLDEFGEFPRAVLENLRQPLEDGTVTVTRAKGAMTFPADFVLLAAMNPCPCGYATDPERACSCTATQRIRYRQKVSGPIMDRIDLHVDVPRVQVEHLEGAPRAEDSATIRARVEAARARQTARFGNTRTNSTMLPAEIERYCPLDASSAALLRSAAASLQLSARAYHRLIKIARTIADLAGEGDIAPAHIAEAINYRFAPDV